MVFNGIEREVVARIAEWIHPQAVAPALRVRTGAELQQLVR